MVQLVEHVFQIYLTFLGSRIINELKIVDDTLFCLKNACFLRQITIWIMLQGTERIVEAAERV